MGHAKDPTPALPADHRRARAAGQGLVEYILILALIAIVALVALSFFGTQLSDLLTIIANQINP